MTYCQFYQLIDELLELDAGTIGASTVLVEIQKWDSLAIIGFIALLDEHFGISVPASKILEARTGADLAALADGRVQD